MGALQLADVDPAVAVGIVLAATIALGAVTVRAIGRADERREERERDEIRRYHRRGLP